MVKYGNAGVLELKTIAEKAAVLNPENFSDSNTSLSYQRPICYNNLMLFERMTGAEPSGDETKRYVKVVTETLLYILDS
jgi:hypothetical protein